MNSDSFPEGNSTEIDRGACDQCGSSDAHVYYADGHSHCHKCGHHTPASKQNKQEFEVSVSTNNVTPISTASLPSGQYLPLNDRNISVDVAKKYCIESKQSANGEITSHYYRYYDKKGNITAVKERHVGTKDFNWKGNASNSALFGQNLFNGGGKMITLCEGELDAASVYQMNGGYPAVSVQNGAQSALKSCKRSFEFLDKFEEIIICFDNDDAGRKAANDVAELFAPGKCSILTTELKDPNEYLKQGRSKQFMNEFWNNKRVYAPDGIICFTDMWDNLSTKEEIVTVDYPWEGLQDLSYGMRLGELCTYAAGTGQGKSTTMREIAYHIINTTKYNVGMMFLEESVKRTGLALMGIHANKPFHLPTCQYSDEEFKEAFDALSLDRRVFLFDHFGSWDIDKLVSRVRYMAKGLECKFIFLDHVSIVVSAGEQGDERRALDEVMTKLRMLVQELDIHLAVVTHLKRVQNNGHEEGGVVSLSHLRGSAGIAQLSDMVISLERDSQNDNAEVRNTTLVRVLKNRFSGDTGPASYLQYDRNTGRQFEIDGLPDGDDSSSDTDEQAQATDFTPVVDIDNL